ncbi:hypothetical protein LUZ63_023183 [Rhynchospora breviuscula]|uniref:tryptophan synthase n=1 Tax=Rhynchospora breviuscula TaxID=2022672 RepID=A0A9Q0BY72_9POAL|nr:hypothetical protein LUZ63_023183 [Rhynchospora breviuscula]
MDGLVIQEATQTALANGFRMRDLFTIIREVTARTDVPVLVMTYWNLVEQFGVDRYADELLAAGGAGLITPDITPDAAAEWIAVSERTGLDRVFLAAPTSTDDRLAMIVGASTGFVYTVAGVIEYADGAIVGTALVKALRDGGVEALRALARELSAGTARRA